MTGSESRLNQVNEEGLDAFDDFIELAEDDINNDKVVPRSKTDARHIVSPREALTTRVWC